METKKTDLIIVLCDLLPKKTSVEIISKQLLRSSTSVGANYRASQKSKSKRDFLNKILIVEEEADECCYWLELLVELIPGKKSDLLKNLKEAKELTAIFTTIGRKTRESMV